ncbi:hypothetical protein D3C76_212670 [compost metagenome]
MSKGAKKRFDQIKRIEGKLDATRSDDSMSIAAGRFYAEYLAQLRVKEAERFKK